MSTDLHSLVIPQLERVLTNLRDILERASLDLEQRQIPESVLLSSRLYPDMFDLQQQVQAARHCPPRHGAADRRRTVVNARQRSQLYGPDQPR